MLVENLKQLELAKQRAEECSMEEKQRSENSQREANQKEKQNSQLKKELTEVRASHDKLQHDITEAKETAKT